MTKRRARLRFVGWLSLGVMLAISTVACSSNDSAPANTSATATVESCREQFSVDKGYGFESDFLFAASPGPDAAPPPPPDGLADAVNNCQAEGGSDCSPSGVLTREAAFCVADLEKFAKGIAPWRAGPSYHFGFRRLTWPVQNVLHSEPDGSEGGESLMLDAKTGEVLGRSEWSSTP